MDKLWYFANLERHKLTTKLAWMFFEGVKFALDVFTCAIINQGLGLIVFTCILVVKQAFVLWNLVDHMDVSPREQGWRCAAC